MCNPAKVLLSLLFVFTSFLYEWQSSMSVYTVYSFIYSSAIQAEGSEHKPLVCGVRMCVWVCATCVCFDMFHTQNLFFLMFIFIHNVVPLLYFIAALFVVFVWKHKKYAVCLHAHSGSHCEALKKDPNLLKTILDICYFWFKYDCKKTF